MVLWDLFFFFTWSLKIFSNDFLNIYFYIPPPPGGKNTKQKTPAFSSLHQGITGLYQIIQYLYTVKHGYSITRL